MTATPPPPAATPAACPVCGANGSLRAKADPITVKRRVKFGVTWVVLTIFTGGIALLVWLIWPRRNETVSVDRYLQCTQCGARV